MIVVGYILVVMGVVLVGDVSFVRSKLPISWATLAVLSVVGAAQFVTGAYLLGWLW